MRKISAGLFMSLDGVVESPDKFVFPYFTDEVGAAIGELISAADTMLMGRKLYDEWSVYWPGKTGADDPFAGTINNMPKFVLSNTLKKADWAGTTILSGDVKSKLAVLKQAQGKDIGMSGSPTTVRWLLREGLLDELNLMMFPIVIGQGMHMFDDTKERIPLRLAQCRTLGASGVVLLTYVPDPSTQ
jgi:dihydrofolate reductase